eukprot:6186927-Pleurochrysis_carterae.AAC.5
MDSASRTCALALVVCPHLPSLDPPLPPSSTRAIVSVNPLFLASQRAVSRTRHHGEVDSLCDAHVDHVVRPGSVRHKQPHARVHHL